MVVHSFVVTMEKTFVNEIGNTIVIKVVPMRGIGTNSKTKERKEFEGVSIQIIGPTSTGENNITRHEAVVLHEILSKFLK